MDTPAAFWQEILIRAFRIPVHLAYHLARPSLKDLQNLMRVAVVQELEEQGLGVREIAVALDVSETWVTQLRKKARGVGALEDRDALLARVIARLQEGPASEGDLMEMLPAGASFRMDRVALSLLQREGIVEAVRPRASTYRLSEEYARLTGEEWTRPLEQIEGHHILATHVLMALNESGEPLGEERLMAAAAMEGLSLSRLRGALGLLEDEGLIALAEDETGGGDAPAWTPTGQRLKLIPLERSKRLRTGVMTMLDRVARGTAQLLTAPEGQPVGQRILHFKATPQSLGRFIERHGAWVMDTLKAVDEEGEADPEGVDCQMLWLTNVS